MEIKVYKGEKKNRKKTRATGGVEAGSPSLTEWVASHDCLSSVLVDASGCNL